MSDGLTGYEIEKVDKSKYGTEIKLFLNKVGKEYLKKEKVQEIIKKYSDHVQYPIKWVDTKSKD